VSYVEEVLGGLQLRVPPDGFVYVEVEENSSWRLCDFKLCRRPHCRRPAVAELNRGLNRNGRSFDSWWAYCERHLYGRRIVDGKILSLRLLPDPELREASAK